ncbi:MAG: hypothetical protein ACYDBR_07045 [Gaiellaceae bacterium]
MVTAAGLLASGVAVATSRVHRAAPAAAPAAGAAVRAAGFDSLPAFVTGARRASGGAVAPRAGRRAVEPKPPVAPRATISLYERTTSAQSLRRQGCGAARRGAGGIVILDFGKPSYDGHTYGTILFSGAFAGNAKITAAMLGYARGYVRCLPRRSLDHITLSRGTSNYHPAVPSAYQAGRRWARETRRLSLLLAARGLGRYVTSAAADDVEPAWDRTFSKTFEFYRGYRDASTGHLLYNYGSLDGGVGRIWNARQAFYVAGGMKYGRAIPEIYSSAMAREWATLARVARHRYHRPVRIVGVMTEHTSANRGVKPRDAHRMLLRELASAVGPGAAVPATLTNITSPG